MQNLAPHWQNALWIQQLLEWTSNVKTIKEKKVFKETNQNNFFYIVLNILILKAFEPQSFCITVISASLILHKILENFLLLSCYYTFSKHDQDGMLCELVNYWVVFWVSIVITFLLIYLNSELISLCQLIIGLSKPDLPAERTKDS